MKSNDINKKNKAKEKRIIKPKRVSVRIIFLSIIVAVVVITPILLFIFTYKNNNVTPFESETTAEYVKSDALPFEFDFYCTDYQGSSPNTVRFTAAAYKQTSTSTISNIKYKVCIANDWAGYLSNTSSSRELTLAETKEKATYGATVISNYDLVYPKRVLLIINIKEPTAYVNITYTEKKLGSTESTTKSYILTYSYSAFFINSAIGGLN